MERTRPERYVIQEIAAAALGGDQYVVEPVLEGGSTFVYRLVRGTALWYLRVLPEEGATFAPEAAAHALLCRRGVHVPEVVHWEACNPVVERSVMITTAIKGRAIGHGAVQAELPDILRLAGRDLALLNYVPVDGFGWVRRDAPTTVETLRAELLTEREFMLGDLDRSLDSVRGAALGTRQIDRIRDVVRDHSAQLDAVHACLAHGDLDPTHIYSHRGHYTGIIDLGEIRGTGPYYDLGHFRFHVGETLPLSAFAYLLDGYREVTPLSPETTERRIALASLLIGVGFLARTHTRLSKPTRLHALAAIARDLQFFSA